MACIYQTREHEVINSKDPAALTLISFEIMVFRGECPFSHVQETFYLCNVFLIRLCKLARIGDVDDGTLRSGSELLSGNPDDVIVVNI